SSRKYSPMQGRLVATTIACFREIIGDAFCSLVCSLHLHLAICTVFRICDSESSISFAVLATPA
ncbi:MAG: hypothetical protein P8J22_15545, partial [Pseudomonadales bacterium]|nr:hypothetical protein [Pseudomonadales bacterium]